jgi:hypothetical protein
MVGVVYGRIPVLSTHKNSVELVTHSNLLSLYKYNNHTSTVKVSIYQYNWMISRSHSSLSSSYRLDSFKQLIYWLLKVIIDGLFILTIRLNYESLLLKFSSAKLVDRCNDGSFYSLEALWNGVSGLLSFFYSIIALPRISLPIIIDYCRVMLYGA